MWVQFGSWTYDGTKLDLQPDLSMSDTGVDLQEYMDNGEFRLLRAFAPSRE
jgi:hypothetical protein